MFRKKYAKLGQRGREGLRDLLLEFLDSIYISGRVEAGNVKFGTQIDHKEYSPKRLLRATNALRGWSSNTVLQIQDGTRRHVGFSINGNNSGVNRQTSMKLVVL